MARVSISIATGGTAASMQTPAQTVVAGNLLVATMWHQSSDSPAMSDTSGAGITWHTALATTNPLGDGNFCTIKYAYNIGGTLTNLQVTATWLGSAAFAEITVQEFDTFGAADPLEASGGTSTGSGSSTSATTGTLTVTGTDIIVSTMLTAGSSNPTGSYNWSTLHDSFFTEGYHSTASNEAATGTVGNNAWIIAAAAFTQTGGPPPAAPIGANYLLKQAVKRASFY